MAHTVAVVGHRDVRSEDLEHLAESLREWWKRPSGSAGRTSTLLTCLAPGADQLAAAVLSRYDGSLRVCPVYPYAEEAYTADVADQARRLQAEHVPWSFASLAYGTSSVAPKRLAPRLVPQGDEAREAYQKAGRALAHEADVLLALWDGVHNEAIGGTADTVRYATSADCQLARATRGRRPLAVYWLATPRRSNPYPSSDAFSWQRLHVQRHQRDCARAHSLVFQRAIRRSSLPLGVVSFVCSVLGYFSVATSTGVSTPVTTIIDAAMVSISHLALNGLDDASAYAGAGTLARGLIRAGRLLAVLFAGTAAVSVTDRLFSWIDNLTRSTVALLQEHDVVIGLSASGLQFVADTPQNDVPTIVCDDARAIAKATASLSSRSYVAIGDPASPGTVDRLGIRRARHVFVACGDDDVNVQVVTRLARTERSAEKPLVCCVELSSQQQYRVLERSLPKAHHLDVRMFNAASVTARMFLQSHPLDRFTANPTSEGAELVVLGDAPIAIALILASIQAAHYEAGKRFAVCWITPNAAAAARRFVSSYPVFTLKRRDRADYIAAPCEPWSGTDGATDAVLPSVRFLSLPESDRQLLELFEQRSVLMPQQWCTTVVVALRGRASSATAAGTLAQHLTTRRFVDRRDVTLCYRHDFQDDEFRQIFHTSFNNLFSSLPVTVLSDFMGDSRMAAVLGDRVDRTARHLHAAWARRGSVPAVATTTSESDLASADALWAEASVDEQESSRLAASHLLVKQRIQARLTRLGRAPRAIAAEISAAEHRRWCAASLLDGYRPLTRIPTVVGSSFELSTQEIADINRWFTDGEAKKAFKRQRLHASLLPLRDLGKVIPERFLEAELDKDGTDLSSVAHCGDS